MCGIAGIVQLGNNVVDPAELEKMLTVLHHRGPDDGGCAFINRESRNIRSFVTSDSPLASSADVRVLDNASADGASVGFGHRRFSIIDLSVAGHQPFLSDDGTTCLTFNGEIYNYVELREALEAEGQRFRSTSDTEVVLRAYLVWGVDCFEKFLGFWALAIYDARNDRIVVSRDRLGKKPLYWSRCGSTIYFASEIKALLEVPDIAAGTTPDARSIWLWCSERLRDVSADTFFGNIKSFPAGSWALVDESFPDNARRYWQYPDQRLSESDISVAEAKTQLRELLFDAVRIRLRADVPLAVSLSGGMDSSTIVAIASQISDQKLTTYTIKYEDPRYNEEPFAREVAARYNVDYRVMEPPTQDFWQGALPYTYLQEEPYHSPHQQTGLALSTAMRSQGIKVCLHGAAGDELFAGYPFYFPLAQRDNWQARRYLPFLANAWNWTENRSGRLRGVASAVLRQFRDRSPGSMAKTGPGSAVSPLDPDFVREYASTKPPEHRSLSDRLYFDVATGLIPYWLSSGDKKDMAVPLEYRCPLLDHRIVEMAMRLPTTYLVRNGWHKWILRKAVEDLLPSSVVWRRQKMGLPFPMASFLHDSAPVLDELLSSSENPYLNLEAGEAIKADWKLISLDLWHGLFFGDRAEAISRAATRAGKSTSASTGYQPAYLDSWKNVSGTLKD